MEIGIIGLGDMGKLYANKFVRAGYAVNGCDLPVKRDKLEEELSGIGINILEDGIAVSRNSDMIFYSVEAENIEKAIERYLPKDVNIVTCHSLHGPSVDPIGQSLVVIRHRSTDNAYKSALNTL